MKPTTPPLQGLIRRAVLRFMLGCLACGFILLPRAAAYVLEGPSWPLGTPIVLNLQLGAPPASLLDGSTSWNDVATAAMAEWNPSLGNGTQFQANYDTLTPTQGDKINSVFFSDTVYGEGFGSDTLAITLLLSEQSTSLEADVLVNKAKNFDSYRGPLRTDGNGAEIYDLRRVLIHEFGHVLGLDHAPQGSQSIMTPVITDIDTVQQDDIAGVTVLYGTPDGLPLITSAASVSAVGNKPFQFQIAALGATRGYTASGLPPGLSLDPKTGLVSGVPTVQGVFRVAITASNYVGTVSATLTITVAIPPVITSALNVTAIVGQPFSYSISAANAPTSFGTLYGPACNPVTGVIAYTPIYANTVSFQISASNFAGTSTATLSITSVYDFNAVTLHQFTGAEGIGDYGKLVQATDGSFYGTSGAGGNISPISSGFGTIFRMTPDGAVTVLHAFNTTDGSDPNSLLQVRDGNLYGTTRNGGANNSGTVFRITPAGDFTLLHDFAAGEGRLPLGVVEGSDGNLYGTTDAFNNIAGSGTIFRVTPDGALTTLYAFDGSAAGAGLGPSALALGADGNLYGTTDYGGPTPTADGTIFRCTLDGTLTAIHVFDHLQSADRVLGPVVQAADGNLYGITYDPSGGPSRLYRCSLDGQFTQLNLTASFGTVSPGTLSPGKDGALYTIGVYTDSTGVNQRAVVRYGTDGTLTLIHQFGKTYAPFDLTPIMQGNDGAIYGGLPSTTGIYNSGGTIFKIAPNLGETSTYHPGFFAGETALSGGVYYLAFSNGNVFGYYSYLTSPHFVYHFDMGYEYWVDAADGHNGIYFYDFKSRGWFYTSPGFPFPYLYDFSLNTVLYYYPDPDNAGHYNTDGVRYFYRFDTGQIITK